MRLACLAVVAAVALGGATRASRSFVSEAAAECAAPSFDAATAVPRTAAALEQALEARGLHGKTWLGRLASVGAGRRDTLVWTSGGIDPARPVELVVYFEGFASFTAGAMDHRHAAAIERVAEIGNAVYVAPDAPSSAHGNQKAATPYWRAGCAARACAGGHAAPGDFVAFLADVRARVAVQSCLAPEQLRLHLHLVGFSNGGKGVRDAIVQLAAAGFTVGGRAITLGDVVFADGNYGARWLPEVWAAIAARAEAPGLTILVGDGRFDGDAPAGGNRRRAAAFLRAAAPGAATPARGRVVVAGRLRLVPLPLSHHGIGDAAVDHLRAVAER